MVISFAITHGHRHRHSRHTTNAKQNLGHTNTPNENKQPNTPAKQNLAESSIRTRAFTGIFTIHKNVVTELQTPTMKSFSPILASACLISSSAAFAPSTASAGPASRLSMAADADAPSAPMPNPAIKLAANGMSLLKPLFALEANLQAAVLGAVGDVDKDAVASDIDALKSENDVLIYTYGLSPFSSEALSMLDAAGCDYKNVELGKEWFLLGGEGSETRVALSREVEGGATSLPKIFIGGECIGGCAELANLVESGELDERLKAAKSKAGGPAKPNFFTNFFA